MSGTYVIQHSDKSLPDIVVPPLAQYPDPTKEEQFPLTFVGFRSPVYGEALWTNMLHLLENFAAPFPPAGPVIGQIWVDTSVAPGIPKVFNNTSATSGKWSIIGAGLTFGSVPPHVALPIDPLYPPDLWFNPVDNSLKYTLDGINWIGINCFVYASQLEYNYLVDSITTIAAQVAYVASVRKIDVTAASPNTHPTVAMWSQLLTDVKGLARVVRTFNASPANTPPLSNVYWDNAIQTLSDALARSENFHWCPSGTTGLAGVEYHGMSVYSSLFDVIHSVFTNVTTWHDTPAPQASFTQTSDGAVPLTVTFRNTSSTATTSLWSFGDGTIKTQADQNANGEITHQFQDQGVFTVSLMATNVKGHSTTTSNVTAYKVPISAFKTTGPLVGLPPMQVTLLDTSLNNPKDWIDPNTGVRHSGWLWDFGDGVTATTQNVQHTYTNVGTYTVSLVVSNQAGTATNTATTMVIVALAPVASFTRSPTYAVATAPLAVSFTDTTINAPTEWKWDFGDGSTSTEQNPTHTYVTSNLFTVKLTSTNLLGSHTHTFANCVATSIPPVADIGYTNPIGATPLNVAFTDHSTNAPTAWSWNFGDGATSSAQHPSHIYTTNGVYSVTLTVQNAAGTSTKTIPNLVNTQFAFNIVLSGDEQNVNIASKLYALGWNGASPAIGNITINGGVVISANSTGQYALRTGATFPAGSNVTIINYGYIVGMGGQGGNGNMQHVVGTGKGAYYVTDVSVSSGLGGGPALGFDGNTGYKVRLYNYGYICGGGGGGGGSYSPYQVSSPGGGGGRTGRTNSPTGSNGWGYAGTFGGAGGGVTPGGHGNSGPGGNWGAAGGYGSAWPGDYVASYGGGGGNAVVNSSGFSLPLGTWGTYYGAIA